MDRFLGTRPSTRRTVALLLASACLGRATSPATPPPSLGSECHNTCTFALDGICDDGGDGHNYDSCELGSDCADCGPRLWLPPPPPPARSVRMYRTTTVKELRRGWNRAIADRASATFEIPPGSHFRLRNPLVCNKAILFTVFSRGPGAILDGTNKSQIFTVKGCSLTLRGLALVNGMAPAGLKEQCRDQRTGLWRPYAKEMAKEFKPACQESVRDPPSL